jgi:hypothetical protein
MHFPVESMAHLVEEVNKYYIVFAIKVDVLVTVPARSYVMQRSGILETQWACHGVLLPWCTVAARKDERIGIFPPKNFGRIVFLEQRRQRLPPTL